MRRNFGWAFALVLLPGFAGLGAALAADLPVKAAKATVVSPDYDWSGFYAGADAGGAWIRGDAYSSFLQTGVLGFDAFNQRRRLESSGFIGGVYAGYNWQVARLVVGIEGDISGIANANTSATAPNILFPNGAPLAGGFVFSRSENWLSTVRGRIGYAVAPNFLIYVTGGAAVGDNTYLATYTEAGGRVWPTSFSKTSVGYAVGAGGEWMVTRNWLLRAEYLYANLPGASSVVTQAAIPGVVLPFNWDRTEYHVGRAGIAYKFGGPIVAKY
jgi:outer membrane immunogenic protein